jgi:hypothetical protein
MSRPRYPSDDARLKRPSGISIAFSVMHPDPDHPEHSEVFQDPELRGVWLGLLLKAGQAFAGRTSDVVTLSRADLIWVTAEPRRDRAVAKLRTVCGLMGYEVRPHRDISWAVHVKNLSKNQGWTPQATRSAPRTPSASESYSYNEYEEDKKREECAPPAADAAPPPNATEPPSDQSPIRPRKRELPAPPPEAVQFAEDFRKAVQATNPGRDEPTASAFAGWCNDARLLLARRTEPEARELARWLFTDEGRDAQFWRGNVFCVGKFREKFDAIRKAKERNATDSRRTESGGARGGTILDAGQRVLRSYGAAS